MHLCAFVDLQYKCEYLKKTIRGDQITWEWSYWWL